MHISSFKEIEDNVASDFWLKSLKLDLDKTKGDGKGGDLDTIRFYLHLRAVKNFVRILTKKNIKVSFANANTSGVTNGKEIFVSGDINKNLDVSIGVSCHEACHVVLSDFEYLPTFAQYASSVFTHGEQGPANNYTLVNFDVSSECKSTLVKIHKLIAEKSLSVHKISKILHIIGNIIEDRRIDSWALQSAPGYQLYYQALYNDSFFSDEAKEDISELGTQQNIEEYITGLLHLINPLLDLDVLPGLRDIAEMIDLDNIDRLSSTKDSLELSADVLFKILTLLAEQQSDSNSSSDSDSESEEETDENGKPESGSGKGSKSKNGDSSKSTDKSNSGESESDSGESESSENGESGNGNPSESGKSKQGGLSDLSDSSTSDLNIESASVSELIDNALGEYKKVFISEELNASVNSLIESNAQIKSVKFNDRLNNERSTNVVYFDKFDKRVGTETGSYTEDTSSRIDVVNRALSKGKVLAKRLQIRDNKRETVYNRLDSGSIDKRQIHALGFDSESVFKTVRIDLKKNAHVHISIDGSGSMRGEPFENTVALATMIASAFKQLQTVDVVITYRTTYHIVNSNGYGVGTSYPYLVKLYDSKRDSLADLKRVMLHIRHSNYTPEGLTYDYIKSLIPVPDAQSDSYFINIADGNPQYQQYSGKIAIEHTASKVREFEKHGIKCLGFYITYEHYNEQFADFRKMFKNATKVNPSEIMKVAKVINTLLMK